MTRATAVFARQLLLVGAGRDDRSRREAAGMATRAPRADLPAAGRRRWGVLAVVSAAQFLIILDLWVVNIALPALQRDFAPATLPDVSWILDVYAIVLAALLLPAGRAADSIGRRRCFLAGLVVFGVASLGVRAGPGSGGADRLPGTPGSWGRGADARLAGACPGGVSVAPAANRGRDLGCWHKPSRDRGATCRGRLALG
jgi:Major Facilitator Superfamily